MVSEEKCRWCRLFSVFGGLYISSIYAAGGSSLRGCEAFSRSNPRGSRKLDCHARKKRGLAMTSEKLQSTLLYLLIPRIRTPLAFGIHRIIYPNGIHIALTRGILHGIHLRTINGRSKMPIAARHKLTEAFAFLPCSRHADDLKGTR